LKEESQSKQADNALSKDGSVEASLRADQARSGFERFFSPNYDVNNSARLFQSHYENVWDTERDKERHPRWMDSTAGRFGIRLFSRGLLGSAFLTAGTMMLERYQPASRIGVGILPTAEEWAAFKNNPKGKSYLITRALTPIARAYDFVFGKPIEYLFGKEAVTFRRMRNFEHFETNPAKIRVGRSYGEEAVGITLDFAMGSIGDAWGRRIAGILDPNVKKDWIDKDGHVQWVKLAKATGKATFDILSYNQMEDWFAAIPYVYQMRWQRHALDREWRGSRLAIEHGTFGGAFEVDKQGKIIGDYAIPGAIDLQLRFTGYNVYTLLFRDLYQHAKHTIEHWNDPEKPQHERSIVEESAKYLAKTFLKANTYMLPAMPFFWIPRVSSARMEAPRIYAGGLPHEDCFVVASQNVNGGKWRSYNHFDRKQERIDLRLKDEHGPVIPRSQEYHKGFDPYGKEQNHTAFSAFLRPFGKASDVAGNVPAWFVENAAHAKDLLLGRPIPVPGSQEALISQQYRSKIGHRYFNNAFSYTPYMIAKYESANWWDTPQMDASLYRTLDGLDTMNWGEIKAGLNDYWHVLQRKPVSDKTEQMTYEPRGLLNSQRHGQDGENKRDGKVTQSFADFQRENRIIRAKVHKDEKDPAVKGDLSMVRADEKPQSDIRPRGDNGWAAYEVQRMQQRDAQQRPDGATLH
jgi:hypothetical protein